MTWERFSRISPYIEHSSISDISSFQTSLYLKISKISISRHLFISNISLSQTYLYLDTSLYQTFLYHENLKHLLISSISLSRHISISNISLTATSLYPKHLEHLPKYLSYSSISLTQASLYLKHPSITKYFIFRLFSSNSRLRLLGQCCVNYYFLHYYSSQRLTACQLSESGRMFNLSWIMNNQNLFL